MQLPREVTVKGAEITRERYGKEGLWIRERRGGESSPVGLLSVRSECGIYDYLPLNPASSLLSLNHDRVDTISRSRE